MVERGCERYGEYSVFRKQVVHSSRGRATDAACVNLGNGLTLIQSTEFPLEK